VCKQERTAKQPTKDQVTNFKRLSATAHPLTYASRVTNAINQHPSHSRPTYQHHQRTNTPTLQRTVQRNEATQRNATNQPTNDNDDDDDDDDDDGRGKFKQFKLSKRRRRRTTNDERRQTVEVEERVSESSLPRFKPVDKFLNSPLTLTEMQHTVFNAL